jgi:hypothetical protein
MTERMSILDAAQAYLSAGLCVLAATRAEKRPAVGPWKQYQTRRPTPAELSAWFVAPRSTADAICILCGVASHNLEIIDFDAGGELFNVWWQRIPAELRERLVVERTPSGGWHVIYLCLVPICGNMKLAQRKVGDTIATLIETRGEGGLFLCAPTPGYELTQGDLCLLPRLSEAERDLLLQSAWDLNEYSAPGADVRQGAAPSANVGQGAAPSAAQGDTSADNSNIGGGATHSAEIRPLSVDISHMCGSSARESHTRPLSTNNGDRPGDDFNTRGNVRALLEQHGWVRTTERSSADGNEYWRRPGKTLGTSATLKDCPSGQVFYVFSTNASPFEPDQGYSPFSVYALLEHGGDFEQAARSLRTMGYGGHTGHGATHSADGLNISAMVQPSAPHSFDSAAEAPLIQPLKALIAGFRGLNKPVIHDLLREGETMNVIASPKMGKSWFVSRLAVSIASGLDWMGLTVEPGRVLHIDNELHESTIIHRYRVISEAMDFPHHLYSGNIDTVTLRGRLRDLHSLATTFETIEPGQYRLVILDAFYRALPRGTDENDNGAIANLYNLIDYYASRMQCAFVLIHHTSKGNQSGKSVTDVGAGAGSQSRAADTHLILRPHEENGIVVLESAVRSWPPMPPKALLWKWPLFLPTDAVDTTALLGMEKPNKPKAIELDDFVEQCIAMHDPCSKRSVCYEAGIRLGMSERKAEEMLEMAMERGLVSRIRAGSNMRYVKNRPGSSGDKALWTAALLAHDPQPDLAAIAQTVGATERYVRQIRNQNTGLTAELENDSAELSSGNSGF